MADEDKEPTQQVAVRLPLALVADLKEEAEEKGLALAALIRSVLTLHARARKRAKSAEADE